MARQGNALNLPGLPDPSNGGQIAPSTGMLKARLHGLVESKERQIQQAGALGQRMLIQQAELEERVKQLTELDAEKSDSEELDDEAKERYRELTDIVSQWDDENSAVFTNFGPKTPANGVSLSPRTPLSEVPREDHDRKSPMGSTSASQSRRAKNAAHRADDVEFAFEIGSGLLVEVRRLQSLLAERDKAMQDLKEEKDDAEKAADNLRSSLRSSEQNSDKYKEENWNLEVTLQEIRAQLGEAQATASKFTVESNRLSKAHAASLLSIDTHKNEAERLQTAYDELKGKHEIDVAQSRKTAAGLQREKADLQQALDRAKQEAARATLKVPRYGTPRTPDGRGEDEFSTPAPRDENDLFSPGGMSTNRRRTDTGDWLALDENLDSSPDPSPSKSLQPRAPTTELETLQQKLAHSQRQVNTLKNTLQREKEAKIELRRRYEAISGRIPEGTAGTLEDLENDDDYVSDISEKDTSTPPVRASTRGRGRGRGGRGRGVGSRISALTARLGFTSAEQATEEDVTEEEEEEDVFTSPPKEQSPPRRESLATLESLHEGDVSRTSVDGMDPAFANILRKSSEEPLRREVLAGSVRGRGRGITSPTTRRSLPPAEKPSALAAELGLGDISTNTEPSELEPKIVEKVETSDATCQTDPEVVVVPPPAPVTVEIETQTDPEPIVVIPEPVKPSVAEIALQTDPEVLPVLADASTQSDAPIPRALEEMSIQTDTPVERPQVAAVVPVLARSTPSTQTLKRDTLTPGDINRALLEGPSTPKPRGFLADHAEESAEHTENEADTDAETDTDNYTDAAQSVRNLPANEASTSREDFHSVVNSSEHGFSESDDADSIKASRLPYRRASKLDKTAPKVVALPKPESKEMSIQTDEWIPPAPPKIVAPGFTLVKPGSSEGQQFQFIHPPQPNSLSPVQIDIQDSTLGSVRTRTFSATRRQSMFNNAQAAADASHTRPASSSGPIVDKTKPPMMNLPPPPRQPPPANSMPPPSFIPDRSNLLRDRPPSRPSSPVPQELIQRAASPAFGNKSGSLRVTDNRASSSANAQRAPRQSSGASSFRAAGNPNAAPLTLSPISGRNRSKSSVAYDRSPRSSISSDAGDGPNHLHPETSSVGFASARQARSDAGDAASAHPGATDPNVIHSITQTMIGEYLYKYTRKTIGKGHGDKRHKRFFWVHPYTKTLYWSSVDPGSSSSSEGNSKSAYIDGVRSTLDVNPMPPGLYQYSIIVSTPNREMKFTAPTKERHDIWLNALKYLLARPTPGQQFATAPRQQTSSSQPPYFPHDENRAPATVGPSSRDAWSTVPRAHRSRSILSQGSAGKRNGTAAVEYIRRMNVPDSPLSGKSFEFGARPDYDQDNDDNMDFELHESNQGAEGYDGLDNVRQCCGGKHTIGQRGHENHVPLMAPSGAANAAQPEIARPSSPAWSFRSRTSSIDKDRLKLRFGSRRRE